MCYDSYHICSLFMLIMDVFIDFYLMFNINTLVHATSMVMIYSENVF